MEVVNIRKGRAHESTSVNREDFKAKGAQV